MATARVLGHGTCCKRHHEGVGAETGKLQEAMRSVSNEQPKMLHALGLWHAESLSFMTAKFAMPCAHRYGVLPPYNSFFRVLGI
jgi:hypothetical protein